MDDQSKNIMNNTAFSLEVPLDRKLRDNIRRKVDHYFSLNKLSPPVSYHKLAELSDGLIESNSWDKSYKAFIMVCSGNAVWRSVVGSIAYNRRMLLLPQCLKNSHMCRAGQDELGLLCSECGNCNISGFLREAETLGYITVVTEGTTIASRLIESGNVDAVVGVGCMEVLQKMFSAVRKYSVPAIGVPLLTCGCLDTTADAEWIKEEIRHIEQNSGFRILNINNLRERTNSLFTESQIDELLGLTQSPTDRIIKEMLLAGGKRIRPLLTVLAYEAFSKEPDENILKHLAMSIECFHKASLIHDDIEDNDSFRYGKETIHARYGIPVAINLGDLLTGEGYRLLAECNLAPEVTKECLKVVARGHKALSVGQGSELMARFENEIMSVEDILTVFRNKTSAAFKVSLQLGAIAAGADEKTLGQLDQFSNFIGLAYQLKDDLEDFGTQDEMSPSRNQSVLISMLADKASEADRQTLADVLLSKDTEGMQMLVEKYSIRELTNDLLKDHLNKTELCLEKFQNIRLKLALNEIVGKTFGDYI
jgi:geranylgeranyl diphosphate synthase, type II